MPSTGLKAGVNEKGSRSAFHVLLNDTLGGDTHRISLDLINTGF